MTENPNKVPQIYGKYPYLRRRTPSKDEVVFDLKDEIPLLFNAYEEVCSSIEERLSLDIECREKSLEANFFKSLMNEKFINLFPGRWWWSKNGRFILHLNGYIILFKKLNKKNMPMNISTKNVEAIRNQLSFDFFGKESDAMDPILFFGYQKNAVGQYTDPKIVYIDDGVKWVISDESDQLTLFENLNTSPSEAIVTLKGVDKKKAQ